MNWTENKPYFEASKESYNTLSKDLLRGYAMPVATSQEGLAEILLHSFNDTIAGHGNSSGPAANGSVATSSQVGIASVISLSMLFCVIGLLGIIGNGLVILIILCDGKMRRSVTNLFIMNLAFSDLLVMVFGIPDIVMFMLNRGWILGLIWCRMQRYILVFSVYSSVATQVSVCIER